MDVPTGPSPTTLFLEQCWANAVAAARLRRSGPPRQTEATLLDEKTHSSNADEDEPARRGLREYGSGVEDPLLCSHRSGRQSPLLHTPHTWTLPVSDTERSRPLTIDCANSVESRGQLSPSLRRYASNSTTRRESDTPAAQAAHAAAQQRSRRPTSYTVESQPNLVRAKRPTMGTNGVAWIVQ